MCVCVCIYIYIYNADTVRATKTEAVIGRTVTTEDCVQSEQDYVGYAVHNMPVGHFSFGYYGFPLSASFHQCFKRIHSSIKDITGP